MTSISKTGRFQVPAIVTERMRSLAEAIARTVQRRWRMETTVAQLELRSDRELADMGFSRHDIRRIARQSAAGV